MLKILNGFREAFKEGQKMVNPEDYLETCQDCGMNFHSKECLLIHEKRSHGYNHIVEIGSEFVEESERIEVKMDYETSI